MTTFQGIIFAIVYAFSAFLPIGHNAHEWFLPYLLQWEHPNTALSGAFALGTTLSLFIYYRHDWASIISSSLQVLIFWKKPMTLDERMPLFLAITALPVAALWHYLEGRFDITTIHPLWYSAGLILFCFPLSYTDSSNRRSKNMFGWNWVDSLVVGVSQIILFIPGADRQTGAFCGAFFRNFTREAATKFVFFSFLPLLLAKSIYYLREVDFSAATAAPDTSWLTFWVATVVTVFAGLLAIGGFTKNINIRGFRGYLTYRCILAVGIAVTFWIRSRG